ncbi:hypothetical protein BP5796_09698 [Coleophoma crateriformis]|uniref:Acyltransferase 3 domain-containing protein n=1 Tax=Coleophoma crateriformis TaxID=565419 RepID=A0A3D8QYT6_9HELO|nr:hypothetical protein BP5796_09698 [Coleophoma crateriformis]
MAIADQNMDSNCKPRVLADGPVEERTRARANVLGNKLFSLSRNILPSFVSSIGSPTRSPPPLHATSYLDGLRGIACVILIFFHFFAHGYARVNHGYKTGKPADETFFQLPVLRLLISGPAALRVYFVVSGFAISYQPIQRMRAGDTIRLCDSLGSSALRRGVRLFIPLLVQTILAEWFAYNGLVGMSFPPQPKNPSAMAFIKHWWVSISTLFVRTGADSTKGIGYSLQIWTIPIEFRNSIAVYLAILAFAKTRECYRVPLKALLVIWLLYRSNPFLSLFQGGSLLAELHHMRGERREYLTYLESTTTPAGDFMKAFAQVVRRLPPWLPTAAWTWFALFCAFALSRPCNPEETPGYQWLATKFAYAVLNEELAYLIAALGLVFCIDNCEDLQAPFNSAPAQYLGKICYSLFLLHWLLIQTVFHPFERRLMKARPDISRGMHHVFGGILLVPLLIWAADLFWRLVDRRAVAFSKWLITATQESPEPSARVGSEKFV